MNNIEQILKESIILDIDKFRYSSEDDNDELVAKYNFFALSEILSLPSLSFEDSGIKLSQVYNRIIDNISNDDKCKERLQFQLNYYLKSGLSGVADNNWFLTHSQPTKWFDNLHDETNLSEYNYLTLKSQNLNFETYDENLRTYLNSLKIKSLIVKYLPVKILRKWLNTCLFVKDNIKICNVEKSFFSNGHCLIPGLDGIIPLVTDTFYISSIIELEFVEEFDNEYVDKLNDIEGLMVGALHLKVKQDNVVIEDDVFKFKINQIFCADSFIVPNFPK